MTGDDVDHGWVTVDRDTESPFRLTWYDATLRSEIIPLPPGDHCLEATAVDEDEEVLYRGEKTASVPDGPDEYVIVIDMTAVASECVTAPPVIEFGSIEIGSTAADTFSIFNPGFADVDVVICEHCGEFEIVEGGGEVTIPPEASHTVIVMFSPATVGDKECTVLTGADCADVECSGTGVEPVMLPPTSPADLLAVAVTSAEVDLSWTDRSDDEYGFRIERAAGAAGPFVEVAEVEANTTGYADTGLSPATTYWYRVRAYNEFGQSDPAGPAAASTFDVIPEMPSGLTGSAVGTNEVRLEWTDNSDNEAGFKIERNLPGVKTWLLLATVAAGVTTYTDTDVSPSSTYWYRVRAFNAVGDSAPAGPVEVTTEDPLVGLWIRHGSAYPWSVTVEVDGVWYEIQHGDTVDIPMNASSAALCIWEQVGGGPAGWDCGYTVHDNHRYAVIDQPNGQMWDLTLVIER